MALLYKIKKIKLQRQLIDRENKIYGPYKQVHATTVYRHNKVAVTAARRVVADGNAHADWYDRQYPDHQHGYPSRHEVEIEVTEMPTFVEYGKVEGKTPRETEKNLAAWRSGSASP